jgi:Zn-dependent protease with chaperone function
VLATFRAVISLGALIGFYVFAVALIGGVIFGAFQLRQILPGMYWVIAATAGAGLIVIGSLWTLATWRPGLKPGVDVPPEQAPELWALVTELSKTARTRGPDQIRLVGEVNAAVSEDSRFFGLASGPRRMYLGIPLLQGLTVSQLRAVLAHEFGHFSGSHTRLGPIAYRGWQAIVGTVQQLQGNVFQWPLRVYMVAYILLSLGMSRSQEREADRLMVQNGGRANAQASLREVYVLAAFWAYYNNEFLGLGWGLDLAPTAHGFFDGFEKLLAARADDVDAVRAKVPPEEPAEKSSKEIARELLDSHPPIAVRMAAMEKLPERGDVRPDDDRRAQALIPDFATAAAATAEVAYVFGYRERLEWDDLIGRIATIGDRQAANAVYGAAAMLAGKPTATLATVVALSQAGRMPQLIRSVYPEISDEQVEETVTAVSNALVRAAVVDAGAARYRMSWSGPAELVKPDGEIFDEEPVGALLADAVTASEVVGRLAALGVDVSAVGPVAAPEAENLGEVLGGIADMKSDEATYDVLILENGLLLAERPGDTEYGGSGRLQMLIDSGSLAGVAARHRFVPYASMERAKVSGWVTVKATITLDDGTTLRLKEQTSSDRMKEDSDKVLKQYLSRRT